MCIKRGNTKVVLILFSILLAVSITSSVAENQSQSPRIYVVNYPLQYFAERIGGDKLEVIFPAPSHVDPAYWTPSREIIKQYQNADLILLNGADYAKWVNKVTLPKSKLVNTSQSFKAKYITLKDILTHTHGPTGDHAHKGVAFTTWLDPIFAIEQADSIKEAFIKIMPESKDSFIENYDLLKNDLEHLNGKLQQTVSNNPDIPILASHPIYQYLARQYNLNLKSVYWEPDQMPDKDQLRDLEIVLENHGAKWMIWEAQPSQENIDLLENMGIGSAVYDPVANISGNKNFMLIMNQNVKNLREVYK